MPQPRLIIHGGAGAITLSNLSPAAWARYRDALLRINSETWQLLNGGQGQGEKDLLKNEGKRATALEAATHAVTLLEDCPLFNCAKGAVFTREGGVELEASVMVSHGYHKRCTGVVLLSHVRNPILLAREILLRGETDGGGGAQAHCVLGGPTAERLAREWGLEMVEKEYFWTRKRWEEHRRGLGLEVGSEERMEGMRWKEEEGWDGREYLPQGTVGCVALDREGTLCVATSTGGLTNKLSGRIGDTPTPGAGFWAEEWVVPRKPVLGGMQLRQQPSLPLLATVSEGLREVFGECIPRLASSSYTAIPIPSEDPKHNSETTRAVAVSGTGNGDSFLRLCACRTACAVTRFSPGNRSLASAVREIAGPGGELQRSAGERWRKTSEGEGGMIGIEVGGWEGEGEGKIVSEFNCGGMFRTWVDGEGRARCMVFREEYP